MARALRCCVDDLLDVVAAEVDHDLPAQVDRPHLHPEDLPHRGRRFDPACRRHRDQGALRRILLRFRLQGARRQSRLTEVPTDHLSQLAGENHRHAVHPGPTGHRETRRDRVEVEHDHRDRGAAGSDVPSRSGEDRSVAAGSDVR